MKIGWIGLGAMGGPMARTLGRAGREVAAYDIAPELVERWCTGGVRPAASAAEAVDDADVVGVVVATPAQVRAVLVDSGLVAELKPGSTVIVFATIGPDAAIATAEALAAHGVGFVDAPISGGSARAASGELLIMVGGADEHVAAARPVLDDLASTVSVVGPNAGDGQRLKLVNQLLCGVHVAVAGEALAYAESLGLDAATTWEALKDGAAASFMFTDRGARMVDYPDVEVRSALDIMHKDLGLVTDSARAAAQPTPIAAAALQQFVAGRRAGLGRADDSAMIEVARGR
ncbi:NAD(P)-dependent oxidoreductase [Mariniluteicoccus flavus]